MSKLDVKNHFRVNALNIIINLSGNIFLALFFLLLKARPHLFVQFSQEEQSAVENFLPCTYKALFVGWQDTFPVFC